MPTLVWEDSYETILGTPGHIYETGATYNSSLDQFTGGTPAYGSKILRGWGLGSRAADNTGTLVHRAYAVTHLDQMVPPAEITGPALYQLWVWLGSSIALEVRPPVNDWVSTITVSCGTTWERVVTTILTPDNVMQLQHVPNHGEATFIFQNPLPFPREEWVRQDMYVDFGTSGGYAKLYQNGELTCHASVLGGNGKFTREHDGFYASPAYGQAGTNYAIKNDLKRIWSVENELEADRIMGRPAKVYGIDINKQGFPRTIPDPFRSLNY